ncbi:MAG: GTP cyclohydrolase I FolE [Bacteroidetes bacterium]|nr:GTP cyclohydrolase I FolE [Bacteroidota bacterium]MBS1740223.1 GTP cyclohydrolase I FolE [Bacteroidota bacterium]
MHVHSPSISTEHRTIHLPESEQIKVIEQHFKSIMITLGLDINDNSLKDTPHRVAKMFVKETFSGLKPENEPKITLFENPYQYNQIVLERDIPIYSYCEHHFVPIIGKAHVAYISKGDVIGLSKLNRITNYFAKRPQVQERLTVQIAEYLKSVLNIDDVAVIIKAEHLCVSSRGVSHTGASTLTESFHGKFLNENTLQRFYSMLTI